MSAARSKQRELDRLNRALRTLSGSNRALLHAEDESGLLTEICRVVVEDAGYLGAIVARAEHDDRKSIKPVAQLGADPIFEELSAFTWADDELGRSATGTAIRTSAPCVVNDVDSSSLSEYWRDFAQRRGLGSLLSLPVRVEGEVYGALTILAPEPDAFDELEKEPLLETVDDLAFGLHLLRARERAAAAQATIQRMMYFDPVSGLPNRAKLRSMLAAALSDAAKQLLPIALLRLELERYREIEEALGDDEADKFVCAAAKKLEALVEPPVLLAQIAEAEFAVVLPGVGAEQAGKFAQTVLCDLSEFPEVSGLLLDTRARIGVSLYPGHGTDAEVLLRRAGAALGHARRSGGTGFAFFRGGLDVESAERIALMADLRRAVQRSELELFCQPKALVDSRRIQGAEALIRWHHPSRGTLNPDDFIGLAESTGMITPLTYWVLDAALRQSHAWRNSGIACPISVNLSAHDLMDPLLSDRIAGALATWGAEPGWVDFELTESALMEDPERALATLTRLRALKVSLTIDDFGTGYSSLSYLRRLPIDAIKIDQSFVGEMVKNENAAIIVKATIELAHNLNLKVVAEGVEDERTLTALAELGCDLAQGYCISRPMPACAFAAWVREDGRCSNRAAELAVHTESG